MQSVQDALKITRQQAKEGEKREERKRKGKKEKAEERTPWFWNPPWEKQEICRTARQDSTRAKRRIKKTREVEGATRKSSAGGAEGNSSRDGWERRETGWWTLRAAHYRFCFFDTKKATRKERKAGE